MRKIKKINGYLVVKFNARELREWEGTALGEYGVIDAELYTGHLEIDRSAMEYDGAETLEEAVELARGLESEEDIKHDLIASNPMDNVERPKSQRYVGAFYSVSELETLFQAVKGDPCEFPVLMAAFYGLRRSEIMGLRWRAIDFENNLITIDHTVVQCMCDGTTITVEKDRTKNQSSCRSMPLVPQYRDLLLRMKVRQECCRKLCGNCYTESEYIFVNDMGEPYQPNYVTQHFKLVLRKNHLRNIRFHDLRHTCASLLLKNGVPMKDIQEWLGHSSYNTTANIYAHLDTSSKNTSASKMSNVVIIEPGISTSV